MSDLAEHERSFHSARMEQDAAFDAAVAALQVALDAKCKALFALDALSEAKGHPSGPNWEAIILAGRRDRSCRDIVRRALTATIWNRMGFSN
jgi:hypothetical protein